MLRTLRIFLLFLLPLSLFAQEESDYQMMLNDAIKLAQRPGTERLLKECMEKVAGETDTLTAFFLIPSGCPRCEAIIAPCIESIKKVRPQEKTLIFASYEDAEIANLYVEQQKFGEDLRLMDADNLFDRIFSTTMGGLQGLFIARIDVANGRMITGGQCFSPEIAFFKEFFAIKSPLPFHVYDEGLAQFKQDAGDNVATSRTEANVTYEVHTIDVKNEKPSLLRNQPSIKGQTLLMLDEMCCNAGLQFEQGTDGNFVLRDVLKVDSAVQDTYIKLPPELYQAYKPYYRYMPLDAIFMPDDDVAMSYSIPEVLIENEDGEEEVNLYNRPVFLQRALSAETWQPLSTIDNNDMYKWMVEHFRIFPVRHGHIAMTCHKVVWPIWDAGEKGEAATDPFIDAFYDQENPYAVEVDLDSNKIVRRFGQLEDIFRQTHTGYWFAELVADTHKGSFVYGNQVVGKLYLTSADDPATTLRTYDVFSLGDAPQADSTLMYKEEYLQVFAPYFNHILEQVTLDDLCINCLVRTGIPGHEDLKTDVYEYIRLSRETGKVVERYALPAQLADERLLAYGLTADDAHNRPFYVSKHDGKYYLKFVESK